MRSFSASVALIVLCVLPRPVSAERLSFRGETMGTYYSIVVEAPEGTDSDELEDAIEACLRKVNQQMSTWDPESQISQFNRFQKLEWFAVDPEFAAVVQESIRIHELSGGAFDPTVSPLIDLWGFGDRREKRIPSDAEVDQARSRVGMHHITVRHHPPGLRKDIAGVQLNLSAIAKGYGVDAVAAVLTRRGLDSWVVDIGGEDRAGQPKPDGQGWRIGIEKPDGGFHKLISLLQTSIATSGDYRNNYVIDGQTFSHTIDPATGRPLLHPPTSVSVLHNSCMTADAWATAMMVLGPDRGLQVAERQNLNVMFLLAEESGGLTEKSHGVFAQLPVFDPENPDAAMQVPAFTVDSPGAVAPQFSDPEDAQDDPTPGAEKESGLASWLTPMLAAGGIFLLAVIGMAVGVMFNRRELQGSCGGLASLPNSEGMSVCDLCTKPKTDCSNPEVRAKYLAMEAGEKNSEQ
ncbi:MAG: FAD:protein FMN transferase [Planctomycetaceae bacterium]|nr:FAD:protein FMN transferase [Planctomycetaceae bacterium]